MVPKMQWKRADVENCVLTVTLQIRAAVTCQVHLHNQTGLTESYIDLATGVLAGGAETQA